MMQLYIAYSGLPYNGLCFEAEGISSEQNHHIPLILLGECRTLWGKRDEQSTVALNCYVPKALPVKYEITAHRLCMAYS